MAVWLVSILILLAPLVVPGAQTRAGIIVARGSETPETLEVRARQNANAVHLALRVRVELDCPPFSSAEKLCSVLPKHVPGR
jgi:hypothetical protein